MNIIPPSDGESEPWENVTDVFIHDTRIGTGGFVAGKCK